MKVESLEVSRRPSYDNDYPNQLVGTVKLKGPYGATTVLLSNEALSQIFQTISAEVSKTAQNNAKMVSKGMKDAEHEPLLVPATKVELL